MKIDCIIVEDLLNSQVVTANKNRAFAATCVVR
jgi:hypothetical protein